VVSDQQPQTGERFARVSTTTLMIVTVLLLLVLAGAAIAAWVITRQPPEKPLQVPSVSQAHILF
jgi:flagellar basal body-associated protein FliL